MAKTSVVEREKKRARLVEKYAPVRAQLKTILRDPMSTDEERYVAQVKLQALPRNSCPIRRRSRCSITGRPRGVYKKFGLARNVLRIFAMRGEIPGLVKASW